MLVTNPLPPATGRVAPRSSESLRRQAARTRLSLAVLTRRWGKADSNWWSHRPFRSWPRRPRDRSRSARRESPSLLGRPKLTTCGRPGGGAVRHHGSPPCTKPMAFGAECFASCPDPGQAGIGTLLRALGVQDEDRAQRRRVAISAPSASALNLAQTTLGATIGVALAEVPKPQSAPAITRSRPTMSA